MRLFLYYAVHTVKNQIRKLLKTWVAVFMAVCILFGVIVGLGAAFIGELVENEIPEEEIVEDEVVEEEIYVSAMPEEAKNAIIEAATGGVFLLLLVWNILSANKSGTRIFNMADVNLLFSAPMKPQSVLLFRLCAQLGSIFAALIYLALQIPNLVGNLDMELGTVLVLFAALLIALCYGQLINIFLFTAASVSKTVSRLIAPLGYGIILLSVGGFALYYRSSGLGVGDAILAFLNGSVTRYIPIWGWTKGFVGCAMQGDILASAVYALLLCAGIPALAWVIWHIRADFYEDAMQHSSETAELMAQAQTEGAMVTRKKKDRSDRTRRDGLTRGQGASVIFFKSLYNRSRFALLGIFTKTSLTYLVTSVALCIFLVHVVEYRSLTPVALVIGGFAFFRSLGNPIANEISKVPFLMMPESPWKKVWMCFLSGSADCFLDMRPAFIVATVMLGANPLISIAWMLFILSIDLYSSSVGAFIDLSLSVSINKSIRSVIQIMFIYFGLLPDIALLLIGGVLGVLPLFALIAAVVNVGLGVGVGCLCPMFLANGRR